MELYSQNILEFDRFLAFLADYACSTPGREKILGIDLETKAGRDESLCDCIDEASRLRASGADLPVARFKSPNEALALAAPIGAVIERELLLLVRDLLGTAKEVRAFLNGGLVAPCPALSSVGDLMPDLGEFYDRLERVFDADGEIMDRASPRLAEIRQRLSKLERRLRSRLDAILQNDDLKPVLQDPHIAKRNNRYVVPIRREQKAMFKGVVHDQSNSGRTLFMEPSATLEDGNELVSLELEERDEIIRIFADLSDQVRVHSKSIDFLYNDLVKYDYIYAVSRWAKDYECRYAKWGDEVRLESARHPLLQAQFRAKKREDELVPLDMVMPKKAKVLAVTGSNTGGKTVVLKTVGLIHMLALAGLPVPCGEKTTLRRFGAILADIGDEQSLQQNLSTFSSHLTHIRDILRISGEAEALILLDELGSGTDPAEGSALGAAVLEELSDTNCITLTTTHLAAIKHFVHEHPRMANACVLFNEQTLSPEYRLVIGRPGASHAMTIARRIGVSESVLEKAEDYLDNEHLRLENMLAEMDAKEQRLQSDLRRAEKARRQVERERNELHDELNSLRKDRKKLLNKAQREAAAIVDNSRREMEKLLKKAGSSVSKEDASKIRSQVDRRKKSIHQGIEATRSQPVEPLDVGTLQEGDTVWVEVLNANGKIVSFGKGRKKARVDVNGMSFEVKTRELGQCTEPEPKTRVAPVKKPKSATPAKTELKLLGFRVEQALQELERFLDAAALAGFVQIRIVHGFGTGALREAIHDYLKTCPVIKKFRLGRPDKDEGGQGVTWVEL